MPLPALLEKFLGPKDTPPKSDRAARGRFGEKEAEKALRKAGLKVVTRNWRHGRDEIDLVCRDGDSLVFVEVRTRDESALAPGVHSLTKRKRTAFKRASRAYVAGLRETPSQIRFDLVEVSLCQDGLFDLHHHQNISL